MFDLLLSSPATLTLLVINIAFSLYALFQDQSIIDRFAFVPYRVWRDKEWYRVLTGGFLHANFPHLLFNMITLFFFGPVLELYALGLENFLIVYFGSELAAHLIPLYKYKDSPTYAAVGASGAISGVVFAFILFAPLEPLYLFFIPIGIPAIILGIAFLAYSAYASRRPQSGASIFGKIAHEAHLGGALGGLVLTILLQPSVLTRFFRQLLGLLG